MAARRVQLADRWRGIQEAEEADDDGEPSAARQRRLNQAKEEWYGHATRRSQLRIASRRWGGGVTYSTRISAGLVSVWCVGLGLSADRSETTSNACADGESPNRAG